MAIAGFLARPAERDRMQDRHVVFDDRRFADHDAGCVVEHDSGADARGRMDVDTQRHADLVLEKSRQRLTVAVPQPVRDAMRLQRVKALEEQKRGRHVVARGVACIGCKNVDLGGDQHARRIVERFFDDVADHHRRQHRRIEAARDAEAQCRLKTPVVENRRVKIAAEDRFLLRLVARFVAHRVPQARVRRTIEPRIRGGQHLVVAVFQCAAHARLRVRLAGKVERLPVIIQAQVRRRIAPCLSHRRTAACIAAAGRRRIAAACRRVYSGLTSSCATDEEAIQNRWADRPQGQSQHCGIGGHAGAVPARRAASRSCSRRRPPRCCRSALTASKNANALGRVCDLLIVVGGDGSLLGVARDLAARRSR